MIKNQNGGRLFGCLRLFRRDITPVGHNQMIVTVYTYTAGSGDDPSSGNGLGHEGSISNFGALLWACNRAELAVAISGRIAVTANTITFFKICFRFTGRSPARKT